MRIIILIICLAISFSGFSQKKIIDRAISTDGRRIILYDDNTFRYETAPVPVTSGTNVSDTVEDLFNKPIGGKYQTSPYNKKVWNSSRTHFSVWFNAKKWKLNLLNKIPPEEVSFVFNETTCNVLTERTDVDLEEWIHKMKLFQKQRHPSMIIQSEEWRTVNGLNVYLIEWQNNDNRANFQCYSCFAKGNDEILQMHIAAPAKHFSDYADEVRRILSGIVLNEK